MVNKKTRDEKIDIFKYVCALMVLFLHTANIGRPYSNEIIESVTDVLHKIVWAFNPVEFFFIASSFFLFSNVVSGRDFDLRTGVYKYIKRLSILYLFWSIFYINHLMKPFASIKTIEEILMAFIKALRIYFVTGTGFHMWYVLSLIYALIILTPLLNGGAEKVYAHGS